MIHRTLHIKDWKVDMFIHDGGRPDTGRVADCLIDMDAPESVIERAVSLIDDSNPNEAFTYSNGRRSCIYIGRTTDGGEFVNSLVHELRHLIDHIAAYYGIDNETTAYMSGDTAYLLAEEICQLGCNNCRR